ncbi:uncharacterized protein [Nicotiana sylvestris]|uniref:uncharacterized protein n=1 Tax=Nicotiana sylvestris TaxID=4096 RepID=UPI00388C52E8
MEAIAGLTKCMQYQEARIDKLTDTVGTLMEEESTHTPGKLSEVLESDTLHNRPLYLVGYIRDERVNQILVDGGSSVNILPIRTVKELGIPMSELSESHVMTQKFNQWGQRAIGAVKLEITIEDMQSSAWLHVIDAKTSYNVLLGRPWIHENKVVPSTYHHCLKYYEGEVEKKILAGDEPFTEAESHFADAKFYLKNRIVKEIKVDGGMKSKNDEPITKRADVTIGKAKAVNEENVALPTKRTDEGFDPNASKVFAKDGYNPIEPSKLGKLPSEVAMRQPRESLGYKQPSPVRISIKRASSNYISVEDESAASNMPSVFDRLGKSTVRTSVFERLGPLKKGNKFQRNYQNTRTPDLPKIHKISKDFQSLVPSRMKRQTKVMVSCDEVLKVKPYTVVYTKKHDEDEESVGSSYHVTAQGEHGILSLMEDDEKLDDVSPCYHISFDDGDPQEDEVANDVPPELEEGVKATIDALKEVNLGTDEEPRPTYLSALLEVDEESTYIELLMEFGDVFAWSYKEMPGLDLKVAVHHLAVKNAHVVHLVSRAKLIKFVMSKPVLSDRLARWYLQFQQFEIAYIPQKSIKGQALADLLADHPILDDWELTNELPGEDAMVIEVQPPWKMYFDGVAHRG